MAHTCRLTRAGRGVDAQWRRDGDALIVSPAAEAPFVVSLAEVSALAGDGYTVRLRLPASEISLDRLGGDGPTLLSALWRDWPVLRASTLRLTGGESPAELFAGHLASPALRGPCRCFFVAGRLIVAPEGGDVFALFAADFASIAFDEDSYTVRGVCWDGTQVVFSKLGARSAAFARVFQERREALASTAAAVATRYLGNLEPVPRAGLSAQWLPGRLLGFDALERIAPGFEQSFTGGWLTAVPRARAGTSLMAGLSAADRHLGYAASPDSEDVALWLLACRGETTSLEMLSREDYATYQFRSGEGLPALIEGLIRLPEFSREALYLPIGELSGERGSYAIPARDLPLLRELRGRFAGRKIHDAE